MKLLISFDHPARRVTLAILFTIAILFSSLRAHANAGPTGLGIQGVLAGSNGQPVLASVTFRLQVLDSTETCVLFEEYHTGQDLAASSGMFALNLGAGTGRVNKIDSSTSLNTSIFRNDVTPLTVADCTNPLIMSSGLNRKVRITFDAGAGPVTLSPNVTIQSSAYASIAETLQGKAPSDLAILKDDATTDLTQANLESVFSATNFPALMGLIAGTSTSYERAGRLNGGTIPTVGIGESLRWNGTGWDSFVAGGGTIGVASVTAGSGLLGGTITSNGTLSVNTGTGAGQIVQLDGSAKIPTALLPSLSTAMITSGTLGVANGGTGLGTVSPYSILIGNMTGTAYDATTCSTQGMYLEWQTGAGFMCVPFSASKVTTGTLGTAFGGLGLNASIAGTGQLLIGNGNNTGFTLAQLTAGTGIQIINGAGSIAIGLNGSGAAGPTGPTGDSVWAISGTTINYTDGSVGIGTTAPSTLFEVFGGTVLATNTNGATAVGVQMTNLASTSNSGSALRFRSSSVNMADIAANVGASTAESYLTFTTRSASTNAERMRIHTTGDVGIGTPTPTQLLDVAGPIRVRPAALPSSPTSGEIAVDSAASNSLKYFNGTTWSTVAVTGGSGGGGASTSAMTFNSNTDNTSNDGGFNFQSNGSDLLTISNAGIVNITATTASTSNTTGALTVAGGLGVAGMVNALKVAATSTNTSVYAPTGATSVPNGVNGAAILVKNNSQTDGVGAYNSYQVFNTTGNLQNAYMGAISTTGASYTPAIIIGQQTGANSYAERLRIDSSGNVGIGTTNPSYAFDVVGSNMVGSGGIGQFHNNANSSTPFSALRLTRSRADNANAAAGFGGGLVFNNASNSGNLVDSGSVYTIWEQLQSTAANRYSAMTFSTMANGTLSEKMRIDSSGNVGIGTTSPLTRLHIEEGIVYVNSSTNASSLNLFSRDVAQGATQRSAIYLKNDDTGFTGNDGSEIFLSESNSEFILQNREAGATVFRNNGAETMRIDPAGNVGIGTTAPSGKLHIDGGEIIAGPLSTAAGDGGRLVLRELVAGGTNSVSLRAPDSIAANYTLTLPAATGASGQVLGTNASGVLTWITQSGGSDNWLQGGNSFAQAGTIGTNDAQDLVFETNNNARMTINSGGSVGIGTTNPANALDVVGTIRASSSLTAGQVGTNGIIGLTNSAGGNVGYLAQFSGETRLQNTDGAGYITFWTNNGSNSEKVRISNNGNVGIGLTNPGEKLEVSGSVKATSFITASDFRLKSDIKPVNGWQIISQLTGTSYRLKSTGTQELGLIAQDVEKVSPESVVTDSKSGLKGVKYQSLISPIIEAIKENRNYCEMQTQQLEKEIESLKEKVTELDEVKIQMHQLKNENQQIRDGLQQMMMELKKLRTAGER